MQAFALACGFLFTSLYRGNLTGVNALLFGSFLGITNREVLTVAVLSAAALVVLAAMARPLLFASVDPDVADASGSARSGCCRPQVLLVVLAVAAGSTGQITGALLVFALLVLPPATAQRLTTHPGMGVALSVGIAVAVTWAALALAYYSSYPIGFYLTSIAFAVYLLAGATGRIRRPRPMAATS